MFKRIRRALCAAAFATGLATTALAAVPVHIVKSDLKPLIREAARSQVQFAVLLPLTVSSSTAGTWSSAGQLATWHYAVRVPTAISLSFHAVQSNLPEGATLIVRGPKNTTSYSAHDLNRGELWSRIHPGEALEFSLTVPAIERSAVSLNIIGLQAGYRSLGTGVSDHPYYRQLMSRTDAASDNSVCVTNYQCQVNPSIAPQGSATVALVVDNLYQCTGTLINDVPGDNTPYILTARHCQTGQLGGGNPGAAAGTTVYWDATTPCNATLGSLYDFGVATQTGATTIVEQQDAWLIELNANPVVADAQFAGFDASGGAVQGGYTVHHAESFDKQFTGWFGQAAQVQQSAVLGSNYVSNFLETVNQIGNIGPGASGSGLMDQNHHLVGHLTLGRQSNDASGYGACPAASPVAPNGANGVADFTSLAAVWNSRADTSSSTGSTTLKSVLDPNNTGTLVSASQPVQSISLLASATDAIEGQTLQLSWNAPGASACSAGGGVSGDGWSGALAASGSLLLTESSAGSTTYNLACTFPNGRIAKTATRVTWAGPTPRLSLTGNGYVWTNRPSTLSWNSNVAPCSLTGGSLDLSNLPPAGSTTISQASVGYTMYTLTCGPADNQGTTSVQISFLTPSLTLEQTGSDRILGQDYQLWWSTYADSCVASGGAPGDGWGSTAFITSNNFPRSVFVPRVTTLGTYTYTLTCSSGDISIDQSVTVTFENDAPYATASLAPTTVTYANSPADFVTLNWNSNLSGCTVISDPNVPFAFNDPLGMVAQAQGVATGIPSAPGTYTVSVICTGAYPLSASSTPITLTVLPPPTPTESLQISPSTVTVGQTVTVTWTSTYAGSCFGSNGIPMTGWDGTDRPPAGSVTYTPTSSQLGNYTFTLTCESVAPQVVAASSVQAQLTVVAQQPSGGSSAAGGSHGGGALDGVEIVLLSSLVWLRRKRSAPRGRKCGVVL